MAHSLSFFSFIGGVLDLESRYQMHIIERLNREFPGCFVMKNDSAYIQGIPDLMVLYRDKWAMLEIKASSRSKTRPNQKYYIEKFGEMSFGAFVYPENEMEIFSDLQRAFEA